MGSAGNAVFLGYEFLGRCCRPLRAPLLKLRIHCVGP